MNASYDMAARPTLAVGALRASGNPVLKGSAILWDNPTGLSTTDAHVILQCSMVKGALDPETYGVALGVGSADADIEWLWTARIVTISYPPSNNPSWLAKIDSWSFTIAPGPYPNLDLAVLQVLGPLKWGFSKPLSESFSDHRLEALPLGDSDLASVELPVRVYGFGQSSSHRTQRAAMTGGIISRKTDRTITIDARMLGGHSGGMLLEPAGKVIGWCVWSQTDKVFGDGSLSTPSGLNDARPINLLRPALEAALSAIDPSRTGATLEEKLQGAVPLPVQNQPLIDPEGAATVKRRAKRKAALLEAEAHAGPRGPVDSATEEAIKNGLKSLSASISEGGSSSVPLHVPTLFLLERCNLTRVHLYPDDIASILKVLTPKIERLVMDIHPQAEVDDFGVNDMGGEWMNSLKLALTYKGDCGKLETYNDLPLSPEKVVRSAAGSLVRQQKDSATVYFSNYHVNSLEGKDGMIGFTKLVQKISKDMHAQLDFDLDCYSTRANPFDKASLSEYRHLVYYKVSRGQ